MEVRHTRRLKSANIHDEENAYAVKKGIPTKRQGLAVRGALGDINTNVQPQNEIVGKAAVIAVEFEKKSIQTRGVSRSKSYGHVVSKVDTGLTTKSTIQPSTRPPLRREESTANLAARAASHTRATLKDPNSKTNEAKESVKIFIQTKKCQEGKKNKLETIKEQKESKQVTKDAAESLGKLKLVETTNKHKINNLINEGKLKNTVLKNDNLINEEKLKNAVFPNSEVNDTSVVLPDDIEDIDAGDNLSPLLMSIYIKDIYRYLTELELKYPIEPDFLKKQIMITGGMRATLIDWLVDVQRQFALLLETLQLSVGIIDQYLQATSKVERERLQLVGVTAMFIASKYEEIYAPELSDFVRLTDDAYTKAEVLQCEREIMFKLGFCLARPVPLSFLRRFVKVSHGTSKNHHLAKYFVDLSLVEYSMAHYRPSELAAAAICLSLHLLSNKKIEEVWTPTLAYYTGYTFKHIDPIIRKIAKIVKNVENSRFKAVYTKYLDPTLAKVSSLPHLRSAAIKELAKSHTDE